MNGMLFQLALAVVPTVLAITLHEAAHGYAALALGDTTARDAGRLSLNPLRHIDRMGTIILPGFLLISQLLAFHRVMFMFGWAKPVPIAAWKFRDPRRGMALVAIAGPLMNFALAILGAFLMPVSAGPFPRGMDGVDMAMVQHPIVAPFLFYFIITNLVLGLFNLLPIPPLDGGRVAVGILPLELARIWARLERAGLVIVLLAVFVLPHLLGFDPVNAALERILPWALEHIFWLAGKDLGGVDGNAI
jgi:Zn-dependent protease